MLITKKVKIKKRGNKKISYYKDLGYDTSKDEFEIKIEDLTLSSKILVVAECDFCNNSKSLPYYLYNKNIKSHGLFSCSNKCGKNKSIITNLKKRGVKYPNQCDKVKEKKCETNLKRWGYKTPAENNIIKEKIKETNLKKWGTEWGLQSPEIRNKIKETNLEKWGFESPLESEEVIDTNQEKLDVKENDSKLSSDGYLQRSKSNLPLCTKEKEIFEFIDSIYSGKIVQSYRDGLEIDIYLPELKIGFEFNGLYWHSDKYKDKWYHINKSNYFKDKGIKVIHIWEDDWDFKNKIIKSQIRNWLGLNSDKIFARKCEFKELKDIKIVKKFLNDNHVQGYSGSNKKMGLFYNGELVSIMTFSKLEGRKVLGENEWNLSRFCNKLGTNVVGGASKLLKNFIKEYSVTRIISYADNDWSDGNIYYLLNFNLINKTRPDYK